MQERTVSKRIIRSKMMANMFVWLGFEYTKTEQGYEFNRTNKFDFAWHRIYELKSNLNSNWEV